MPYVAALKIFKNPEYNSPYVIGSSLAGPSASTRAYKKKTTLKIPLRENGEQYSSIMI